MDLYQFEYYNEFYYESESKTRHFLLNIGDLNSDGFDDLFAISANGRYLCLDSKNEELFWVRENEDSELKVTEINDLNNDGSNDFLVKQILNFEPNWISSTNNENEDSLTVINKLYTIDGITGKIIWNFNIPSTQYYDGFSHVRTDCNHWCM